jgi:hypothetical protein
MGLKTKDLISAINYGERGNLAIHGSPSHPAPKLNDIFTQKRNLHTDPKRILSEDEASKGRITRSCKCKIILSRRHVENYDGRRRFPQRLVIELQLHNRMFLIALFIALKSFPESIQIAPMRALITICPGAYFSIAVCIRLAGNPQASTKLFIRLLPFSISG